jgi:hypothetical protein
VDGSAFETFGRYTSLRVSEYTAPNNGEIGNETAKMDYGQKHTSRSLSDSH